MLPILPPPTSPTNAAAPLKSSFLSVSMLSTLFFLLVVLASPLTPDVPSSDVVFVGTTNTGAFVGLIVKGNNMALFVTDGTPEGISVARWFVGDELRKVIQLERTGDGYKGEFNRNAGLSSGFFECWPTRMRAGIYQRQNRDDSVTNWIVDASGGFRSATEDTNGRWSPTRNSNDHPTEKHRVKSVESVISGNASKGEI